MIGLGSGNDSGIGRGSGLDLERTNQNLIDFFPSHTISNVSSGSVSGSKSGKGSKSFYPAYPNNFGLKKKFSLNFKILSNIDLLIISEDLGLDLGIINKKYDGVFSRDNIQNQNGCILLI